jgi:dTDP-glucose 4,6-dehydratase
MENKKIVLVTGGAGFIGSNYLNKFVPVYPDHIFVNIDALTYAGDLKNIRVSDAPNYVFEKADIRDRARLEEIFKKYAPDGVIHFAAESHVDFSITNPGIFVETNVNGAHNLLLLAKQYAVKRFLQVSTDEVYGSLETGDPAFTENTLLAPNSPYSASKAAAEFLARAYYKTFGLDVVITRCSNNYGPNQDTTKLIPFFITKLLAGEQVPLYGEGKNVRDWLHAEDHVDALDIVFHKGAAGEIYNIGGNNEIENIEITKTLIALAGRDETAIQYVSDRLGHDFRYAIDCSKIKRELGWSPKKTFDEGLRATFEFYKRIMVQ